MGNPAGDVSAWAVCRELACRVAAEDADPRVAAAALRAAATLLPLCAGQCGQREWGKLVQGVLLATAGAQDGEVWGAALRLAASQGNHPGWRAATHQLRSQLQSAVTAEEGPLAVYGITTVCRAVAGAAALASALGRPMGLLRPQAPSPGPVTPAAPQAPTLAPQRPAIESAAASATASCADASEPVGSPPDREEVSAQDARDLVQALAVCASEALRYGVETHGSNVDADAGRAAEAWLGLHEAPHGSGAAAEAAALAGAAAPGGRHTAPAASRAALLAAVGAVAAGAVESLRCATGAASGSPPSPARAEPGAASLAAASSLAGRRQGRDAVSRLAAAVRLARLMRRVAALLQDPSQELYSEVGGAPSTPAGQAAPAARHHALAAAAGMRALAALLSALPAPLVVTLEQPDGAAEEDAGGGDGGGGKGHARPRPAAAGEHARASDDGHPSSRNGPRHPQVVIEELPSDAASAAPPPTPEQRAAGEWRQLQQPLVLDLLLLCATYAAPRPGHHPEASADASSPSATGGSSGGAAAALTDPGLPPAPSDIFTPWAPAGSAGAGAAGALLDSLHRGCRPTPPPSRGSGAGSASGSLALLSGEEVSEQDLLAVCGPTLVRQWIRSVVVQVHVQKMEQGPIKPYTGPDPFARALAARRLAWLLMRSRHPWAGAALQSALPALLAACDDPSPGVAQYGMAALHAAAVECLAADLQWQRELLLEQARRLVVGCQEQVWHLACPAAVAIVRRIEGADPRAPGYHLLAPELLADMERQAHVPARRLVFMPSAARLATCLGLTSLRYFSRIMPPLLEWLHAHDRDSRVAALGLTAALVRAAWPRMPAHAVALWRHMLIVLLRACGPGAGTADEGSEGEQGQAEGAGARLGAEELVAGAAPEAQVEVRGALEVCELLLACAAEEVAGLDVGAAGLPAGAQRLHRRLLAAVSSPVSGAS
ncbi:hypothetical protein GPECTOR_3g216 [Gonium pectorale]|uniref:Uncharacterized protein n=1 Tax=Gonium pectorale TaxID=33097 RepID=A0A150GZL4_GONPE|nr:hypothetical protein GPECTOR_3g216 [Gonium pectorale]|eukprot:KXZ55058.1 hypothetical protein GPECTOR_3g216 [Gonium pectorale]